MSPPPSPRRSPGGGPPRRSDLQGHVGLALATAAFAGAVLLGRLTVPDGQAVALVWPAAGVAALWLMLREARVLSLDVLCMVGVLVVVNALTGATPGLIVVFVLSNVGMAVGQVVLLRRLVAHLWGFGGQERASTLRDLMILVATSVVAAAAAAAVGELGVVLVLDVPWSHVGYFLWVGRLLSGLVVVGSVTLFTARWWSTGESGPGSSPATHPVELTALLATTGLLLWVVFSLDLPLAFLLLIPTVWVAKRFTTVVTTWHTLAVSTAVVVATLNNVGPFAALTRDATTSALVAQVFVTSMALLGLFIAIVRDERAELFDRLSEARALADQQSQLLSGIVNAMNQGLVVVDDAGTVVLQNPASARLTGVEKIDTSHQMTPSISMPDGSPMPDERRPSVRALRGEDVTDDDLLLRRVDGEARRVRVSASHLPPLRPDDPARAVMVFHDVTDDVEREEELKAFAGTVAHDLHNPLAAIVGWNAMLQHQLEEDDLDRNKLCNLSTRVGNSAQRLHELIEGLLDHAASKDRALDLATVDLTQLAKRIVEGRDVEHLVRVTSLGDVQGDRLLLGQVLDNLIGNALKYVAPGSSPRIEVDAVASAPGWVTVQIVDNGIGIPDGQHDAVFGEFHRVHAGYQGTGLGLSIVKRIVTRHGGTISASPNPAGPGTVMEFSLPSSR